MKQSVRYSAVMASTSKWDPVTQAESDGEVFLSEPQLARLLGITIYSLQNWRRRDVGPPYARFGRSVRYHRGEVEAWVEAQMHTPKGKILGGDQGPQD